MKYYKDIDGNYLGGWDDNPPSSAIETNAPPSDARMVYLSGSWVVTDAQAQEIVNKEAREYLNSTDWYQVRLSETNEAIPQDILDARAAARARVV